MSAVQKITPQTNTAIEAYKPFYGQLAELKELNKSLHFDYESQKGNKEARSHVYKLRQTKAAIEKARKEEKANSAFLWQRFHRLARMGDNA